MTSQMPTKGSMEHIRAVTLAHILQCKDTLIHLGNIHLQLVDHLDNIRFSVVTLMHHLDNIHHPVDTLAHNIHQAVTLRHKVDTLQERIHHQGIHNNQATRQLVTQVMVMVHQCKHRRKGVVCQEVGMVQAHPALERCSPEAPRWRRQRWELTRHDPAAAVAMGCTATMVGNSRQESSSMASTASTRSSGASGSDQQTKLQVPHYCLVGVI